MIAGNRDALVLFSGGQDSTACLAWALRDFAKVETVGFDYGQRHAAELAARKKSSAELQPVFPSGAGKSAPTMSWTSGFWPKLAVRR